MADREILGILVTNDRHVRHLIGIAAAARKAGKALNIFLTSNGVRMTVEPEFKKIAEIAPEEIGLCKQRYTEVGMLNNPLPPGIDEKGLGTQSRHVKLVEQCDRYITI